MPASNRRSVLMNLLIFGVLNMLAFCECIIDDCTRNTFDEDHIGNGLSSIKTGMQFTKELAKFEYAVAGKFKALHCCAKGYKSIEWLKDDHEYPWPSTRSGLILYPESANQTIYTQKINAEDAGNYTCLLKNDTHVERHSIQLIVFEKAPDTSLITYLSESTEVSVGLPVRLFCEAFVGAVNLPDAYSEATWYRLDENGAKNHAFEESNRIRQVKVSREDGLTFGTYLIINPVQESDFGTYVCKITNPGRTQMFNVFLVEKPQMTYLNPSPIPWAKLTMWVSFCVVIIFSIFCFYMRYGLPLRVKFKDFFGEVEERDGKMLDVLIVYSPEDYNFVCNALLPKLELEYSYNIMELPQTVGHYKYSGENGSLANLAPKSRRLVAVLSSSSVNNQWETKTVFHALKQLNSLNPNVTCILLQDVPKDGTEQKNNQGESLTSVLKAMSVILWDKKNANKCWLALKLRLPPKRNRRNDSFTSVFDSSATVMSNGVVNSSATAVHLQHPMRLNSSTSNASNDSLDNLV